MKELLLRICRHNAWANKHFIDVLAPLDKEILDREIISSFNSIRATILHMWGAEDIWLQRLTGVPEPVWNVPGFKASNQELLDHWEKSSDGLITFVTNIENEMDFSKILEVTHLNNERYQYEISSIIQHVCNHGSYHRGQLVTMMRQAGITSIPGTDLSSFLRVRV